MNMKNFNKILLSGMLAGLVYSSSLAMKSYDRRPVCAHQKSFSNPSTNFVKNLIEELITDTIAGNAEKVCNILVANDDSLLNTLVNTRVYDPKSNYYGWTLLQIAVEQGHEAIVRVLIQNGADINARVDHPDSYHHNWAALHIAEWRTKVFGSQIHAEITKTLITFGGADLYAKIDNPGSEYDGWTALDILCMP